MSNPFLEPRPTSNVWRVERGSRASLLIDADAYYRRLYDSLRQARRHIYIAGWDIDSRVPLLPPEDGLEGLPTRLGPLFAELVRRNPDLRIHVLAWDFAPIYLFEREPFPRVKLGLRTPERVEFVMDDAHPPGASHHQKLVVIDDQVAYSGGLDLCDVRWDTPDHAADDPRRVDLHGQPYRPHHDVQMIVEGKPAAALGDMFRSRWHLATARELEPPRVRRVGSANFTQRSMRLDRECDLSIWASTEAESRKIRTIQDGLLAEHLGVDPAEVRAVHQSAGSMLATIDALRRPHGRSLHPARVEAPSLGDRLVTAGDLVDPGSALTPRRIVRLLMESDDRQRNWWKYVGFGWWGVLVAGIIVARLAGWGDPIDLARWITTTGLSAPWDSLVVLSTFVVGGLLLIPVTLMIANAGLLYGPVVGSVYALLGAFVSAAVYYWLGRRLDRDVVRKVAGPRLQAGTRAVARRGLLAVAAVRLVPVAPHVVVGLAAGAARIGFRDYMLGTILAMAPGAIVLVFLGHRIGAGVEDPGWAAFGAIAGLIVAGLLIAWGLQKWIGQGDTLYDEESFEDLEDPEDLELRSSSGREPA